MRLTSSLQPRPLPRNVCNEGTSASESRTITVVLLGELRRLAGVDRITVPLPPGATIDDVSRRVGAVGAPAFAQRVLMPGGGLQPHVAVFLDGVQLPARRGAPAPLSGDQLELMLVPMYEGG